MSGDDVLAILHNIGVAKSVSRRSRCETVSLDLGDPLGIIEARVLIWPTIKSYTGQPSAEFHTFGSLPVLQTLVKKLIACGARAARPGEFTMRAFLAGRLDLTQAEAVLGVIEAEQRGSLNHALSQLAGNLSNPLTAIRNTLLNLLADVEAGLDFVDEDIEFVSDEVLTVRLGELLSELQVIRRTMTGRGGMRAVPIVAFRGLPNAGKSHLINAIAGRSVAIVADVAGTTRDVISVEVTINGVKVQLVDTAGIEQSAAEDPLFEITEASQKQAVHASQHADIRLWCVDSQSEDLTLKRAELFCHQGASKRGSGDLWIATKCDLVEQRFDGWLMTSAVTGEGIESLKSAITARVHSVDAEEIGTVIGTAARCDESLMRAEGALETAGELVVNESGHEFIASELRLAVECLGEVTGAVYTDDILDRVFSRFCIGK